ncbi:phosphate ABC transporter substrate-binding protein [Desulforhopalus sp. IMCC35007]|uniref:phosphate ABC transporter substrate-binding protein n=1 Tax=Desulforhopalus sp. IMCC35007 TaxID=2569543 RepID=UPI0010AE0B72|nr:phosphate ABC transporter substrate-binding protein [Desulforhopalus sp. IMCC35007]TKB09287.1 phosphate ABC transporter substrate-binding protein [Desulforhopalus sp. IMCC35007]
MLKLSKIFTAGMLCLLMTTIAYSNDLDAFVGQKGILKIAGGTAHIPVMKAAAELIMTSNPDIRITIAGGGTGVGIKQVGEGLVEIGNAGRKATDEEIATYNLSMVKWAIDGVGAVVNPKNSVTALTASQLQDIFAGKIVNWKEVGGEDREINIYDRDSASGTREVFWKKALNSGDVAKKANVVVSNGAMKTAIAGDPYSIGYVSVGHIDATVSPVALDGVVPNLENTKSGSYGVARGLYSLTKGEPAGLAQSFLDFLLSPTGQQIAKDKGFVGVK